MTGSGGIFFSSTAPTHQLLSTMPVGGEECSLGRSAGAGNAAAERRRSSLPRRARATPGPLPSGLPPQEPSPLNTMLAWGRVR